MKIVTTKKQAHNLVKTGVDCLLVTHVNREHFPVIGGWSNLYHFALYTEQAGKIGWTKQAQALQIHV